jgi:hypothetical protein
MFHAKDPKMLYLLLEYGADPTAGAFQDRSLLEEFLRKNPENARALLNYEAKDFYENKTSFFHRRYLVKIFVS